MKLKTLLKNKTLILSVLLSITAYHSLACKNMCVIGAGYVGLIAGSKFAQMGNNVICTDISQSKINDLNNGIKPIFEPGLQAIVKEKTKATIPVYFKTFIMINLFVKNKDLLATRCNFNVFINYTSRVLKEPKNIVRIRALPITQ